LREENRTVAPKRTTSSDFDRLHPTSPHVVVPTAVYTAEQVQRLLGLKPSSLRTAKRESGLVCIRRVNRDWYLGEDLLAWLRAGRSSRGGNGRVEGAPSPEVKED
jgi:hypothetical protein